MEQKGALVKGISSELQDEILSILIFDTEMYDSTKEVMSEHFFYGENYKTLYKALNEFHIQNKANPTLKDMMIQVSLLVTNSGELLNVKGLLKQLYQDYLDEYIYKESLVKKSHFEEFIRRNGAEYCFSTIVESAKSDDGIDWDKVIPKFKKYTDFTIVQSLPYNMGDVDNLAKIQEEALGTGDKTKKIRYFLDEVNDLMNHHALLPGTLTMVSASPGTGKSLSLVNQGVSATIDGFTNLHVFLGDLNKNSGRLRYLACYSGIKLNDLIAMTIEEQEELTNKINSEGETKGALSRNWILDLPAGRINVQQLCNEIDKIQLKNNVHFNQIIIDYDANIQRNKEDLYNGGGEIYNYLREYGIKNSSVMFVASQPKITFYNQEILTLDAASESSQKQHIIDLMLTIGKPGKLSCNVACLFVPKNRDGKVNKKVWLEVNGACQRMVSIPEEEYERIKREAIANADY